MAVKPDLETRELVPPFEKSFAGHDTFAFRYLWLKKGLDHVQRDPEIFLRDDAVVQLGVGKNMVRAIRHWCRATQITEEEAGSNGRSIRCTDFGLRLLGDDGWDPYLEDDASLWLLHWNLASAGTRAATWYFAFNMLREYAFTKQDLAGLLSRMLEHQGWTDVAPSTLERDVDCFVRTYKFEHASSGEDEIGCPLSTLGLLVQESDGERFRFQRGPKPSLPPDVFAYALVRYWNHKQPSIATMGVRDIIGAEGSPAVVFKLDEDSVLYLLDTLDDLTKGALIFEDTPLIRRVVRRDEGQLDLLQLLERYYCGK